MPQPSSFQHAASLSGYDYIHLMSWNKSKSSASCAVKRRCSQIGYPPAPAFAKAGAAPGTTAGVELAFPIANVSFNEPLGPQLAVCQAFANLSRQLPRATPATAFCFPETFKRGVCQPSKPAKRPPTPLGPQLAVLPQATQATAFCF